MFANPFNGKLVNYAAGLGWLILFFALFVAWEFLPLGHLPAYDEIYLTEAANNNSGMSAPVNYFGNVWRPISSAIYLFATKDGRHLSSFVSYASLSLCFALYLSVYALCMTILSQQQVNKSVRSFLSSAVAFAALSNPCTAEAWSWFAALSDLNFAIVSCLLLALDLRLRPTQCAWRCRFAIWIAGTLVSLCSKEFFFFIAVMALFLDLSQLSLSALRLERFSRTCGFFAGFVLYILFRTAFHDTIWSLESYGLASVIQPQILNDNLFVRYFPLISSLPWADALKSFMFYASNLWGPATQFWPSAVDKPDFFVIFLSLLTVLFLGVQIAVWNFGGAESKRIYPVIALCSAAMCIALSLIPFQGHVSGDSFYANRYLALPAALWNISLAALLLDGILAGQKRARNLSIAAAAFIAAAIAANAQISSETSRFWRQGDDQLWNAVHKRNKFSPVGLSHYLQSHSQSESPDSLFAECHSILPYLAKEAHRPNVRAAYIDCSLTGLRSGQYAALKDDLEAILPYSGDMPIARLLYAVSLSSHSCSLAATEAELAMAARNRSNPASVNLGLFDSIYSQLMHNCTSKNR